MHWINKCIQSVLSSSIKSDIFIIDNGSTDGTLDYLKKRSDIILHQSKKNLGFGAANNIGLQYAIDNDYEYVYLLNQDAWIKPETFERLIYIQRDNPDYGIISPLQLQANEKHFDTNFNTIACCQDCSNDFSESIFFNRPKSIYPAKRIMAAHWLISRKCLLTVGGFSPSFHHYGEDDNYADRAWQKGFKVGFVPSAIGIHDREQRVIDCNKKTYLRYTQAISDISGFRMSPKQGLYNYTYDVFLSLIWGNYCRIQMLKNLFCLLKNLFFITANKQKSMLDCAFLNDNTKNK